ncbi:GTP pyrophosphokinase family protein [Rhodococcus sp. NPDC058521]|uniref:GTP pyrophosphokinase n=1 Tax=Rhodococcus sp. NPDC058521 TaxID=3346536 RepID=UPI003657467F
MRIRFGRVRSDFTRFMMSYQFGMAELMTKINILKDEFTHIHKYTPIEHVSSRLKSPESIMRKALRRGLDFTLEDIRANLTDIAGVRITCGFIRDTYKVAELLISQSDITVLEVKDYIENPKPNGYKSLHLIVEVPVFMSDRKQSVCVEVQIRTIAMDFWATLEHKIYYKYDRAIPAPLLEELTDAAEAANKLDLKMERLHDEVAKFKAEPVSIDEQVAPPLPSELLELLTHQQRNSD